MILYLIRHGHAEDRAEWHKPDLERPLTEKGAARAGKAFRKFFSIYEKPEIIVSSEAVRASQTADILSDITGAAVQIRSALNPGADYTDYESVVREFEKSKTLAIVAHEPDMSEFISYWTAGGALTAEFKKGSICHIADRRLINLIQQKVLI